MKIFIYLRMTQDWLSCNSSTKLNLPQASNGVKVWNKYFDPSFFEYRHEIKEIASENWKNVTDLVWVSNPIKLVEQLDDDDLVLPTDDDDWFSPELRDFLLTVDGEYIYWDAVTHDSVGSSIRLSRWYTYHTYMCSNNYALRGSLLKRAKGMHFFRLLDWHTHSPKSAKIFGAKMHERKDLILSGYNRHPGSGHVLRDAKTLQDLKNGVPNHISRQSGPWCSWIEPYSEKFCAVLGKIQLKQIKLC